VRKQAISKLHQQILRN